ncbi:MULTISPECIES: carbon-nitrogen hydrolase family protein [unclassified Campylobacter]|uniref:carbon-nitrogen hydrolase family protein n=1 Tax=unclassified Campylobacter TaxID=2593542 RepID=UPI003D32BC2D
MSKIAILQLPTLPLSEARLDYYLKICKDRGAHLVVLGEYVLNSFFKELENMPKNIIKQQSDEKKKSLTELSKKYDLTIIAPLVTYSAKGALKGIAKFSNGVYKFNEQQILMPYAHWNEAKFFANKNDEIKPFVFKYEELKIGAMFGFEAYFDASFAALAKKKIDVLLVPTASTFDSNARWEELLRLRALTHGIYILRANRIGTHKPKGTKEADAWKFYGDSFMCDALGEIQNRLGDEEEILICNVDNKELLAQRSIWDFNAIKNRLKEQK